VRTLVIEGLDHLAHELFVQEYILRDLKQRCGVRGSVGERDLDSDPARVLFRQIMVLSGNTTAPWWC
jgi:hypothetical protein